MKSINRIVLSTILLLTMVSCDFINSLSYVNKYELEGKPYELILVCNKPQWDGAIGDSLRSTLAKTIPYLLQEEPAFDVQMVPVLSFSTLVEKHRNILKLLVEPTLTKTSAIVEYDTKAKGQVSMTLQGPSEASIIEYLSDNGDKIVQMFESAERDRATDNATLHSAEDVESIIKSTLGVTMSVPKGYIVADTMADFVWARYEYPNSSQGFFVYSYPYYSNKQLSEEALTETRNLYALRIPGPSNGSYMITAATVSYRIFKIKGRTWIEMRGIWDLEGDYMGGPYVSYTTIDETTRKVFTFDGYVYSPKYNKRNYLKGVEHLFHTIKFPAKQEDKALSTN